MEVLICLAIVWMLWLISSKRWRQRLIQPLAISLIGFIIITSPVFIGLLTWGLTAAVPSDLGDRADTIVVLGRGPNTRTERLIVAWQLWQAQRASSIFASGMMDAQPMVNYLQDNGVPTSSLAGEECSQTTAENAIFTSALLHPQRVKSILLVTDPLHMWRSLLVFRSVGFSVIPYTITPMPQKLSAAQQLINIIREYFGMINYALSGKFRDRSTEKLNAPSPAVMQKIVEWNCSIPRD